MQANRLTEKHSVSGQIEPSDVGAIKAAGFTAIICNRPDGEAPGQPTIAQVAAAAEAAGIAFHANPMVGGTLPGEIVEKQGEILRGADAPVLAYCASGRRSTARASCCRGASRSSSPCHRSSSPPPPPPSSNATEMR